jgi:hypothetical protein
VALPAATWCCGGREADWIRQWVSEEDEDGRKVRRGIGVASGDAGSFITYNNQGPRGNVPGLTHLRQRRASVCLCPGGAQSRVRC